MSKTLLSPLLLKRERGGWLALSPPIARHKIGTEGYTPEQAKERWEAAYKSWMNLFPEYPDDELVTPGPGTSVQTSEKAEVVIIPTS